MFHKIIFVSIVVEVCGAINVRDFIKTSTTRNIIETCIVDIIISKTLHGADVAVIKDNVFDDYVLRKLHESNNVRLYLKDHNMSVNIVPSVYLVHNDDKDDFGNMIRSLDSDWYRQPHALFVIALTNMSKDDLQTIFEVLLDYHIIHVLILIEDEDEDASVYSYYPYAEGGCGRDYNNSIKLGRCKTIQDSDIIEKLRKYDKPNLKNCTFNILAHDYPPLVIPKETDGYTSIPNGIENYLVKLLLESENISLNLTSVPETVEYGHITDNFTVTGVMEELYENEIDLLFGGCSLNYRRAMLFDFIYIHLAFQNVFMPAIPITDLEDRWKIVYMMFDYKVWLLLLFTIYLCSLIVSDYKNLLILRGTVFSELLKFFGNATHNVQLNLREKLYKNLIIIHWLWFIFVVSCYYQTRLTSYSTYRAYKPQINKYMSLQNYNLTPCIPQNIVDFLNKSDIAPIINEQYLETRGCETADLALDELANTSSKYTVTVYYRYLWWAAKHLKEKTRIHLVQDNIYKTHYALFFKRGFPLLKQFAITMTRIVEYGFVDAIKGLHRLPEDSRLARSADGAFMLCALTVHDLIVPFAILAGGHVAAFFIIIIEIVTKKEKKRVVHQNKNSE